MKKIACCILLVVLFTQLCACMRKHPSGGIWYSEELNLTIEFEGKDLTNSIVKWENYDIAFSALRLEFGVGGKMNLCYYSLDNVWITVYEGSYSYEEDEFSYNVRRRMNPDDPGGDLLDVDETYFFTLIDDYDEIGF